MDFTSYLPVDVKGGIDDGAMNRENLFFPIKAELFGSFKSQGLKSYQIIWCVVRCLEARSWVLISTQRPCAPNHSQNLLRRFCPSWSSLKLQEATKSKNEKNSHCTHNASLPHKECFHVSVFHKNMLVFLRKKNPISPRLQLSKVDPQQRLTSAEACELEVFKVGKKRFKSILRYSMLGGETSWRDVSFHLFLMRMKVDESLISRWGVSKPSCFFAKEHIWAFFDVFLRVFTIYCRIIGIPLSHPSKRLWFWRKEEWV